MVGELTEQFVKINKRLDQLERNENLIADTVDSFYLCWGEITPIDTTEITLDFPREAFETIGPVTENAYINPNLTTLEEGINARYDIDRYYVKGHYEALYSFAGDADGSGPSGWDITEGASTSIKVVAEKAGHKKVLEFFDNSGSSYCFAVNDFTASQVTGTIEFYLYGELGTGDANDFYFYLNSGTTHAITLRFDFDYNNIDSLLSDETNWSTVYNNLNPATWYHIRLVFDCTTDTFDLYVNNIAVVKGKEFRNSVANVNKISFNTYMDRTNYEFCAYIDAVDYSWAPGYYTNRNYTESGRYAGLGCTDAGSAIKNANLLYRGKYNFKNDADGSNPSGWTVSEPTNTSVQIIAEKGGHYKVVEIYDNSATDKVEFYNDFTKRTSGSIEFFAYNSNVTYRLGTYLNEGTTICLAFYIINGNFYYWDGNQHFIKSAISNKWYHIKLDWNASGWQVWIDGILYGSGYTYKFLYNPPTGVNRFYVKTEESHSGYYCYIDAVDYSWDPGYYINRNLDIEDAFT